MTENDLLEIYKSQAKTATEMIQLSKDKQYWKERAEYWQKKVDQFES